MGSYKSIMTVVLLGGVLLFLAGLLVTTDRVKPKGEAEEPTEVESAAHPIAEIYKEQLQTLRKKSADAVKKRAAAAARAETNPDVADDLAQIRASLQRAVDGDAPSLRQAEAQMQHACAVVRADDWPLIEEELRRADLPRGYRGMLLSLAGASRASGALAVLETEYATRPLKALRAIEAHATDGALDLVQRLYGAADSFGEKYGLINSLPAFPRAGALSFAAELLLTEEDPGALRELATVLRKLDGPGCLAALDAFIVRAGERESFAAAMGRAMNSMAAVEGGTERLLELAQRTDATGLLAQNAFSYASGPQLVPTAMARISRETTEVDWLVRFVERNATPAHADDLEAWIAENPTAQAAARFAAVKERF